MRFKFISLFVATIAVISCQPAFQNNNETIDLSGTWKFQLDSANAGKSEKWFTIPLNDSIKLPGTTDENKNGIFLNEKVIDLLNLQDKSEAIVFQYS